MSVYWALWKRQLAAYFLSPIAYVTWIVFQMAASLSFCKLLTQSMEERLKVGDLLFGSIFFWLMVLVAITVISMPVFAEERRLGTLESLLTAPVTDTQVVLAKYFGALTFFMILGLPTLTYGFVMHWFRAAGETIAWTPIITGYSMLLLISAFFIAWGVWASALTRSQIVAAMLCFAGISGFFFSENVQYLMAGPAVDHVLDYLSSIRHMLDASRGIVDSRPLVLYLSGIAFFLFATVKAIEARQWK